MLLRSVSSELLRPYNELRRLVAGLSPRRPGFEIRSVHVGFVVDRVALRQVFPPSTSVFPCQFHSTGAPLKWKIIKNFIFIIFLIGLQNKPSRLRCVRSICCGAVQ
jgi:hypothetical protein